MRKSQPMNSEQQEQESRLRERLWNALRATGYLTRSQCDDCVDLVITELKKAANES
jgi:hypothetical protein